MNAGLLNESDEGCGRSRQRAADAQCRERGTRTLMGRIPGTRRGPHANFRAASSVRNPLRAAIAHDDGSPCQTLRATTRRNRLQLTWPFRIIQVIVLCRFVFSSNLVLPLKLVVPGVNETI